MNGNILDNSLGFLKQYWIVILLFLIAGNILVWRKYKDSIPVYEQTIKVKARGQYYDSVRRIFDRMAAEDNWKSKNVFNVNKEALEKVAYISSGSYRNEDMYILELRFGFKDSTGYMAVIDSAVSYLHRDPFFKEQYYDRLDLIDQSLHQNDQLVQLNARSNQPDSLNHGNAIPRLQSLFDLKFRRIEILRYKEAQLRELEFQKPVADEIHFVPVSTFRPHVIASILFFVFGFFFSVLIDQLRKKTN